MPIWNNICYGKYNKNKCNNSIKYKEMGISKNLKNLKNILFNLSNNYIKQIIIFVNVIKK